MRVATVKLQEEVTQFFQGWGYVNAQDFMNSAFHPDAFKRVSAVSSVLGTIGYFLEGFVGLKPIVYIAFIALLVIETITGIKASKLEGEKFSSKRFGRMIIKIGAYTVIIGIVNILSKHVEIPTLFGMEIAIFTWTYFIMVTMIILQLLISVSENFVRLGYKEFAMIGRVLKFKLKKIENEDNPKVDQDGQ